MNVMPLLTTLGVDLKPFKGSQLTSSSPIDGSTLASLRMHSRTETTRAIRDGHEAFALWRLVPAPKRGELIRLFGEELRRHKADLAHLITVENGKILSESAGEVQEMIDICDFAVGLSRQLHGLTIVSERPEHTMMETYHPLGLIGVISAFNFPVAVWAWNFALALVCGDPVLWKPSEKTPLCALACQALFTKAHKRYARQNPDAPLHLSQIILGDHRTGAQLVDDTRVALLSATGSTRMGRAIGPQVATRFGRSLLELGGNNAVIVSQHADLDLALNAIVFGAVGTAGQRCTTIRRAFVHKTLYAQFFARLRNRFEHLGQNKIGNPLHKETLIGPLIDGAAFRAMQKALRQARQEGGQVHFGARVATEKANAAFYVQPALVQMARQTAIVKEETFAPILYVMPFERLEEAVASQNDVNQGLSSSIFTTDLREAEYFRRESDCGIANVNIGTSGAEIGGAFGGEKDTGGGRESGSDAWKNYMRRQTSTLYFGVKAPILAQGVTFDAR